MFSYFIPFFSKFWSEEAFLAPSFSCLMVYSRLSAFSQLFSGSDVLYTFRFVFSFSPLIFVYSNCIFSIFKTGFSSLPSVVAR